MANRPKTRKSKRTHKKVSVSFQPGQHPAAKARAKELGFKNSFSAYVQKLIDDDIALGGKTTTRTPGGPPTINSEESSEDDSDEESGRKS